jgi:rod shape-determining protein MreC
MSYPQKNNFSFNGHRANHRLRWFIFALVIIAILFTLRPTRNLLFVVARPFWKLENYLISRLSDSWLLLSAKRSLVEENRRLQEVNNKLNYYILTNDFLQKENENLREAVGRHSDKNHSVLSYVLIKPGKTPYDIILIDAGQNYNIEIGDLVAVDGTIVIGEVTEVYSDTSKVELYSTPGKILTVLIGPNSIQADASGVGDGNFRVKLPKETEVKEGDNIVIPSISTNVFGVVEKIEIGSTETFKDIYFKNPVNLSELKFVEILKNSKKTNIKI